MKNKATALLFSLLVMVGCHLPPAVVLSQANPNPLIGQRKLAVASVVFATPLRVGMKSEEGYLANKSPGDVANWAEAKDKFNANFASALASRGLWDPGASFTVRPAVAFIEPGFYVGVASAPAQVDVEVSIVDQNGKEIDRIAMRPIGGGLTVGARMANCGLMAGAMVAEYLQARTR